MADSSHQGDATEDEVVKGCAQSSPESVCTSSNMPLTLPFIHEELRAWKVSSSSKFIESKRQSENLHSGRDPEALGFNCYAVDTKSWIIMLK